MIRRSSDYSPTRKRDLNHLQSSSMRLEDVDRRFQILLQRIEPIRLPSRHSDEKAEEGYQRKLAHTLEEYEERIDTLEHQTQQALADQMVALHEEGETSQAVMWKKVTGLVEKQSEWLQETIERERDAQLTKVHELQDSYQDLQQTIDHRKEFAAQAIESAKNLFVSLNNQYKLELSWRNEMPRLELKLRQAECNLEMGFEETALAGAQQLFQEMTGIQIQMETFMQQRQHSIDSVRKLADRLSELINKSRYVRAIDLDGKALYKVLDVDYWADGQFRRFDRQVNGILRQIKQPPPFLRLEEIDRLGKLLVSIREQVPDIILQARMLAISSQMRANIAEYALAALRSQGYELISGGFQGSDMRQAYHLELGNLAGNQVVVDIFPVNNKPLIQHLAFQTMEKEPLTDHEIQRRQTELEQALQCFGLNTGDILGPEKFTENHPISTRNSSRLRPISMGVIC